MNLTVFGATGGVGRVLVSMALEAGHRVTAFVRDPRALAPREGLVVIEGALHDAAAVHRAVAGADAVLSTLGARSNTPEQVELFATALTNITQAMQSQGVRRLVSISGAAVLLPGDHVTWGRRAVRALLMLFSRYVGLAKEREAAVICATDLEWVLVRPPRIVPGPATGTYRVLPDRVPSASISQGDVAHLMLACARGDTWVRRAPILGY